MQRCPEAQACCVRTWWHLLHPTTKPTSAGHAGCTGGKRQACIGQGQAARRTPPAQACLHECHAAAVCMLNGLDVPVQHRAGAAPAWRAGHAEVRWSPSCGPAQLGSGGGCWISASSLRACPSTDQAVQKSTSTAGVSLRASISLKSATAKPAGTVFSARGTATLLPAGGRALQGRRSEIPCWKIAATGR